LGTPATEERIAASIVWRIRVPLELDDHGLARVLRQVMRAGYEAGRWSEKLRSAKLAAGNRRVGEAARDEIVRLVNEGEPHKCIAAQLGIGTRTVQREVARLQDDGRLPRRRETRRRDAKARPAQAMKRTATR
jgi:hypothetical protein